MKAIVTGANGTVGQALMAALAAEGITAVSWNRHQIPVNDPEKMRAFLIEEQPDLLFHLAVLTSPTGMENEDWLVNRAWPQELAKLTAELNIRFLFTSSVMVFTDNAKGPFTVDTPPDATEGSYGYGKLLAEQDILSINPNAVVARIGWQIGEAAGSNNMIDFLTKQMAENGEIRASSKWLPACSFLADTAVSLITLAKSGQGLYLVDSNTKWTFFQIVQALNKTHANPWQVTETADFVYDQRMQDARVDIPDLSNRLPSLTQ